MRPKPLGTRCVRFVMTHADDVPLLGDLRTPAVVGAIPAGEETPVGKRTDRDLQSDSAPRREKPFCRPGCLSPSTIMRLEEISLSEVVMIGLPPTPLTRFPQTGESVLNEHCKRHEAVTRLS